MLEWYYIKQAEPTKFSDPGTTAKVKEEILPARPK